MKKFDLPLVADVAAISLAALLFFFCVFRFYLHSLAAAAALGFLCAAAAGTLAFLLFSRRRGKRRSEKGQKKQADELALRLALCGRNECAKLFERALNAANEVAVDKFVKGIIKFGEIPYYINEALQAFVPHGDSRNADDVLAADARVRELTQKLTEI